MISRGFSRSKYDSCVYIKWRDGVAVAFLLLYVDVMLIASCDMSEIELLKRDLHRRFEMKDLENTQRILVMDIKRDLKKWGTLAYATRLYA